MAVSPKWSCPKCRMAYYIAKTACDACGGPLKKEFERSVSDETVTSELQRLLDQSIKELQRKESERLFAPIPDDIWKGYIYPRNPLVGLPPPELGYTIKQTCVPVVISKADLDDAVTERVAESKRRMVRMQESGPGIAPKIAPTPPQKRRLQTTCWAPYDMWDSLEDA